MAKPENTFIAAVHRHLPKGGALYVEKMNNPYRAGGADCWYSGRGAGSRDLWIEWKFLPKLPVRSKFFSLVEGKSPMLSPLQQHWLRNRFEEGRSVWVGVGSPLGGIFLRSLAWELPVSVELFNEQAMDRKELASTIAEFCVGAP